MCQPDYPEVGRQCLTSSITYKGSMLLDNKFKQNMLDLSVFYKSLLGLCTYEGSKLVITTKESMMDWSTYKEYKLGIKLVTSLSREIIQTLFRFFCSTWVLQILFFLFFNILMISSASSHLEGRGMFYTFCLCVC